MTLKEEDKICLNCKYIIWQIAYGNGLSCGNLNNREVGKAAPHIPSRNYSCNYFESKKNEIIK
jgi:hypothetical protein